MGGKMNLKITKNEFRIIKKAVEDYYENVLYCSSRPLSNYEFTGKQLVFKLNEIFGELVEKNEMLIQK